MKRRLVIVIMLLLGMLSSSEALAKGDAINGKTVFKNHCSSCHGINGDGNSPMSNHIEPVPSNFVSKEYKDSSGKNPADYTDDEVKDIIMLGKKGTTMVEFASTLKEQEIEDVLTYIRSLHEGKK